MNTLTRTLKSRMSCVQLQSLECIRHKHKRPVEILTFILDGLTPVHIEKDEGTFNLKIGTDDIHLMITAGEAVRILENL